MSAPDLINACFEASAMLFVGLSVRRVFRDKQVKGVSPLGVLFFTTWGFWNLYYYASLAQWASWAAGGGVAVVNVIWLVGLLKYR